MLLGSLLVMFLRARHWQVGACVIHIQPAKRTLRMSKKFLGSLLVMFLRARHWQVGACVIHIQPAKRTLRMCTKLAFLLPTYFHFTSCRNCPPPPCATGCFGWHCLQSSDWTSPLFPTGVPSVIRLVKLASHSGKAGDDITSDCLTCCNNCFNRLHLQRAQVLSVLLLA